MNEQEMVQAFTSALELFARAVDKWSTAVDKLSSAGIPPEVSRRINDLESDVKETHRTLHGYNGEPGVIGEMEVMKNNLNAIKDAQNKINDNVVWIIRILVMAIAGALLNLVIK